MLRVVCQVTQLPNTDRGLQEHWNDSFHHPESYQHLCSLAKT